MNMHSDLTRFLSELRQKALRENYVFRGELEAEGHARPVTSSLYRWVQNHCAPPGRLAPRRLDQSD